MGYVKNMRSLERKMKESENESLKNKENSKSKNEIIIGWWKCPVCGGNQFEIIDHAVLIEYGYTDGYICTECKCKGIVPYKNI